jgi:hypothetical protein
MLIRSKVLVHSRNEQTMARVFAIKVQGFMGITSVAVQGLWRAGHKSRYTEFYKEQWRGRGIRLLVML